MIANDILEECFFLRLPIVLHISVKGKAQTSLVRYNCFCDVKLAYILS